jgi:hypothetical protein
MYGNNKMDEKSKYGNRVGKRKGEDENMWDNISNLHGKELI